MAVWTERKKGAFRGACKWKLQQGVLYVNEQGPLISMQLQPLTIINMLEYLSIHKGTHLCVQGSSINPLFEIVLRPSITFVKIGDFLYFIGFGLMILRVVFKILPKLQISLKFDIKLHYLWSLINTPFPLFCVIFQPSAGT